MMILRSAKTVRLVVGLTRNLIFNSHQEAKGPVRVLSTTFPQRFTSTIQRCNDKNVWQSIKNLDEEVSRTGRITLREIRENLEQIRDNGTASSAKSLLLIRCCGNLVPDELPHTRTLFVQEVWHTLNKLNVPMDISHYNALLQVYLENEHSFHPTEFVAYMESKCVKPNRVTYQRLISRYCQEGDIDGATKIVEFMREERLPINEHVFNALIMGHSEANDIKSSIETLSVMKQAGLEPTSDTYTHLMCAYAKHGMLDDILSTLDNCEANGNHLLDKDLFKIIYKLATSGHSDCVDNIMLRLRKLTDGYNKHAENLILRLVNKGQEDVALKILKAMPPATVPDGVSYETGAFFIRQMIKLQRRTEKILYICREIQQAGLNNGTMLVAAEAASGNINMALLFFREAKRNQLPLRQDYFWPLICAQGKVGTDALSDVLRVMQSEFGMTANGETVRDYVLPSLKEKNLQKTILRLQTFGIPKPIAVTSCVCHALTHDRIEEAATVASIYAIYYQPSLVRRPLVDALIKTSNFRSWVSIVRSVYENLPRLQKLQKAGSADIEQKDESGPSASEVVGMFAVDAVIHSKEGRLVTAQEVLSALVEQGLSVSTAHAARIKECLGSLLTPKISFWLAQLASGKLEPVPYKRSKNRFNFSDIMPTEHLDQMIQRKEARSEYTTGMQWALLQTHFKANDVQKTEQLIEKLLRSGFILTPPLYSQLIDLYCRNKDLDKALTVYAEIKLKEPDFVLDKLKAIEIVHQLITNDRIDEAIEFLKSSKGIQKLKLDDAYKSLNLLAESGRDVDLTKVFNALEENDLIKVNNVLLGLLIKVHLVNNDIRKAMQSFENICTKYKCTPWKNQLSCTLINLKDATTLQLLVDLSTKVHGEVNSLYDLLFSFIECGCIQQARKILETPALHSRPQALTEACERYRKETINASLALETLIKATGDLKNINHHELNYNLLLAYCQEDSPVKAMNLWTKIQKESEAAIPDKFLTTLASLLKENGVKIPFVVPKNVDADIKKLEPPRKTDMLNDAKAKDDLNSEANVNEETKLLKKMVKENQLDLATQLVLQMLEANNCPSLSSLQLYLNNMARAGQYQAFELLAPRLSAQFKQRLLFVDRLGRAYATAGKTEQFFDQTLRNCCNATTAEELKQTFPSGAIRGILDKRPELILKFEQFAESMAQQKQFLTPMNVMWSHHITNGKLDQANRIVKSYLHKPPSVMFTDLLRTAVYRKDETIALSLLNSVVDKNVSDVDLATMHSCLIDVYCSQQKFDEALRALDRAIGDVSLETIKRTTLVSVKDGLESEGKKFPYQILDKKKVNGASGVRRSSTSDCELRDKWDEFKQMLVNIFEENVKF